MSSTPFSIRLPNELRESLAAISRISHRSQSEIASKAIAEYVAKNEWKLKAIQEAKQEADKGVFISQEATLSWLDSWGTDDELEAPSSDSTSTTLHWPSN